MNKKAYTLIEFIIAIAIILAAFYSLISVFINAAPQNIIVEDMSKSIYLGNSIMEKTMAKNFSSITDVSSTSFSPPFNGFNYEISVDYMNASDPNVVSISPTSYKKVSVRVFGGKVQDIVINTLVSTYSL